MHRFIARIWAKQKYIFSQHSEAATNDLHAGLSLRLASEKRSLVETLNKEADDIEANIKSVDEKLTAGYWECEKGHEYQASCGCAGNNGLALVHESHCHLEGITLQDGKPTNSDARMACPECFKSARFISLATMTGQEKYESDKERGEAEKIAKSKREQAKAEEENLANSEKTARYFKGLADNNRKVAEKIKSL